MGPACNWQRIQLYACVCAAARAGWLASSASAAAPASFCRVLPPAHVVHAALAPRPGSCRHIMSSRLRGA
jgi:hypothetical protein